MNNTRQSIPGVGRETLATKGEKERTAALISPPVVEAGGVCQPRQLRVLIDIGDLIARPTKEQIQQLTKRE